MEIPEEGDFLSFKWTESFESLFRLKPFLMFFSFRYAFDLYRTPEKFLHEIVLVDDKSELEHLHERLETEIKKPYYQGKVKLVRNKEREGLIRSRNNGAIAATGSPPIIMVPRYYDNLSVLLNPIPLAWNWIIGTNWSKVKTDSLQLASPSDSPIARNLKRWMMKIPINYCDTFSWFNSQKLTRKGGGEFIRVIGENMNWTSTPNKQPT